MKHTRYTLFVIPLILMAGILFAQPPQKEVDSLNFNEYLRAKQERENQMRINASIQLETQLNTPGLKNLVLTDYQDAEIDQRITMLRDLESFTCIRCKRLDVYKLFNQLKQCSKLRKLDLSGCDFQSLTNNISALQSLEELNLSRNALRTFPDSLISISRLKKLDLSENKYLYDDEVYTKLSGHSALEELSFAFAGLFAVHPSVGRLPALRTIDFSGNGIRYLPSAIRQCGRLEEIYLNRNDDLDIQRISDTLQFLPRLKVLSVRECYLPALPSSLCELKSLEKLDVSGNRLSALPQNIGSLRNLRQLLAGYAVLGTRMNTLTSLPLSFSQLTVLEELDLSGNQLAALPAGFSDLSALRSLNLSYNSFSQIPADVFSLQRLTSVDFASNPLSELDSQIAQLQELRVLRLAAHFFLKPNQKLHVLPEAICSLKNLEVLDLSDHVIDSLPSCWGNLSALRELSLRSNLLSRLPDSFIRLSSLEKLDLKGNEMQQLPAGFSAMSSLRELNFAMNLKADFSLVLPEMEKMKNLQMLDLSFNNLSDEVISALSRKLGAGCAIRAQDYKK